MQPSNPPDASDVAAIVAKVEAYHTARSLFRDNVDSGTYDRLRDELEYHAYDWLRALLAERERLVAVTSAARVFMIPENIAALRRDWCVEQADFDNLDALQAALAALQAVGQPGAGTVGEGE